MTAESTMHARILLIDDDLSIQRAFRRVLSDAGHEMIAAGSAAEADAALRRGVFDVCLLDLHLGTESGLELLPSLVERAPWMRVIVVTASNNVTTAIATIRAGAADYVVKPCRPEELLHAVSQQLQARRLE